MNDIHNLGAKTAVASVPESLYGFNRHALSSVDSIRRYAEKMNALGQVTAAQNFSVGYHNHFWEWNRLGDGSLAYDLLGEQLSAQIVAEADLLWAAFAGQNALEIISRLSDRVRLLHAGDASPVPNTVHQLAAGSGDVPLAAALDLPGIRIEAVFIEVTTPPPSTTELDLTAASSSWLSRHVTARS